MKDQSIILLVFCVVSVTLAKPPPIFLEYKDSLGQYSFGYSAPDSARSEVRSLDGSTRGSYSYVDDAGVIQSAQYTADKENGFQVIATNLPQAPRAVVDTPEVAAARRDHLKALEEAEKSAQENPEEIIEDKIDGSNSDSVVIEDATKSDAKEINKQAKSVGEEINKQAKSHQEEIHPVKSDGSEIHSEKTMEIQGRINAEKDQAVKVEKKSDEGVEKELEKESMQRIESQSRAAVQSDVPVVTTSFVIPGTVNLHTRIELDQRSARLAPEASGSPIYQPSIIPGSDYGPSTLTPAGTKMMTTSNSISSSSSSSSSSERKNLLMKISPRPPAAQASPDFENIKQSSYSLSYFPEIIGPSSIVAVPYAVDNSPIYAHYNPYQYFPFGLL